MDYVLAWVMAVSIAWAIVMAGVSHASELSLGTGILSSPTYPGANERTVRPVGSFRWETARFSIRNSGPGLEADFVPSRKFDAGPIIRFDGGRNDDIEDAIVLQLDEVDSGIEAGGFISTGLPLKVLGIDDPAIVTARLDLLQEFADGHGGFRYAFSIGAVRPANERLTTIFSLGLNGNDEAYSSAYFGISNRESEASGLAAFSPEAGLTGLSLSTVISASLTPGWSLTALFSVTRLIGDAADSPIIKIRGTEIQPVLGLFLSYNLLN